MIEFFRRKEQMSCKHYLRKLNPEDRHYIMAEEYNNCCICAAETGPKTQEEVGTFLGLSKMRISQIEKQAIRNLKKKLQKVLQDDDLIL